MKEPPSPTSRSYRKLVYLIQDRRLTEAFSLMQQMIATNKGNTWILQEEMDEYLRSYGCMKEVLLSGVEDARRDRLYGELQGKMMCLADQVAMQDLCQTSDEWYHSLRRSWLKSAGKPLAGYLPMLQDYADNLAIAQALPDGGKSLMALQQTYYKQLDSLFLTILTNIRWSHEEWAAAQEMLLREAIPPQAVSLTTSAVTLSLQKCFDPLKLQWILRACHHPSQAVYVRALVGMMMVCYQYPDRLKFYPEWRQAVEEMLHTEPLRQLIKETGLQLIRAQQTETACQHIKKEIIPDIIQKEGFFAPSKLRDILQDGEADDFNPDWKATEAFEQKMEEIAKMQQEGIDIQYTSFSSTKHLPFFVKEMAHWFLPFDSRHPEVADILDSRSPIPQHKALLQVLQMGNLCPSDCYSLCLLLRSMSEGMQQQVFSRLAPPEVQEMLGDDFAPHPVEETPRQTMKLYLQDLYRFYRLQEHGSAFYDIFTFEASALTSDMCFYDPEFILGQADLLFGYREYDRAIYYYAQLERDYPSHHTAELFQKVGYCNEKKKAYDLAATYYERADGMKPGHPWTLRHLAFCLRNVEKYDQAIACYDQLDRRFPDDTSTLYGRARTLTCARRYDEALKLFYKVDYLQPDNPKVWRGIVWCSLSLGRLEQAEKYGLRLLDAGRAADDLMNMGHLCVLRKAYRQACDYYREAAGKHPGDSDNFRHQLQGELRNLVRMGCPENDLHIIYDIVSSQQP